MKKRIILIIVLTLGLIGTSIFAADNDTATATAVVKAAASIAKDTDINFGDILGDGVTPTLDPVGGNSHSDILGTGTAASLGEFTITAYDGGTVGVTLAQASTLMSADGGTNSPIKFTPTLSQHASTQGSAVAYTAGTDITLSGSSTHKIWVGGSIELAAGGALTGIGAGTYTTAADGDVVLTVVYQ